MEGSGEQAARRADRRDGWALAGIGLVVLALGLLAWALPAPAWVGAYEPAYGIAAVLMVLLGPGLILQGIGGVLLGYVISQRRLGPWLAVLVIGIGIWKIGAFLIGVRSGP